MINTGEVASFIDDVIVGTKEEEGHDEIVKEVVTRLTENNLYVKPEKYKWKFREVGFLGVVIGPERIKIEKEEKEVSELWIMNLILFYFLFFLYVTQRKL